MGNGMVRYNGRGSGRMSGKGVWGLDVWESSGRSVSWGGKLGGW